MFKIDLTYLESISGGDKAFINEMLNMLLNSTFTEMVLLKQYASNHQWEQMGSSAHKIKAPIQMLGVAEVSNLIIEIEETGKHKVNTESVLSKIEQLDSYMTELSKQINEMLTA